MGPRAKIVIGALLAVGGVWWYVPSGDLNTAFVSFSTLTNLQSLIAMVQGGLGLFAILIGIFIVWIESDELRIRREMEKRETAVRQPPAAESGGAEVDYEEIVTEHTVDDIKDRVRSGDLDPSKVLAAEQANKDRVTLTEWLENRD